MVSVRSRFVPVGEEVCSAGCISVPPARSDIIAAPVFLGALLREQHTHTRARAREREREREFYDGLATRQNGLICGNIISSGNEAESGRCRLM